MSIVADLVNSRSTDCYTTITNSGDVGILIKFKILINPIIVEAYSYNYLSRGVLM